MLVNLEVMLKQEHQTSISMDQIDAHQTLEE